MTTADPLRPEAAQRSEVDPLRSEVDPLRVEIDLLRVEVDPLLAEVDLLRVEADRLSAEVDPLRAATVLVVSVHYAPENSGFALRTTAMARDLSAVAELVTVFTGTRADTRSALRRIPGQTRRRTDHDHGVQLVRLEHHQPSRPGGLSGARYERSFLRAVLKTPLRSPPDLVIGVLPSVGAAVAAARVARRFRVPLLLVVHDVMAPMTREGGLIGSAVARGQAEALRQASRVVLVGAGLRASVIALGVEKARIDVLSDWAPALPAKQEPATVRGRLGIAPEDLLVLHVGNIGPGQDVSTLVRAARRIAGGRGGTGPRDLHLLLAGEGSRRAALQAASVDLAGVHWLDQVSAAEYPGLLSAADLLVVTEPTGSPDRTLPSRLESFLRAGRPVVAAVNPGGDAGRMLRSVPGAAVLVPPGDSGALASVLLQLRDDAHQESRLREGARGYAEGGFGGAGAGRSLRDVVRTTLTARVRRDPARTRTSGPR